MESKKKKQKSPLVDLYRSYKKAMFKRLELNDPHLADLIEEILKEVEIKNISPQRQSDSKIFAALYMAAIITGNCRTQKEIYQISGVAPQTIIATYKEIAEALDIEVIIPYYKRNIKEKSSKESQKIIESTWQELGINESDLGKDLSTARANQEIAEAKLSAVYAFVRNSRKAIEQSALSWENFKYTNSELEKLILEARSELAEKDLTMLKTMALDVEATMFTANRIKRAIKDGATSSKKLRIKNCDAMDKFIREAQRKKIKKCLGSFKNIAQSIKNENFYQHLYWYKDGVENIEKQVKHGVVSWEEISREFGEEISRQKLLEIVKNATVSYLKEKIKILTEKTEKDVWKQKDWIREIWMAIRNSWEDSREIKNPEIRRIMVITWEDLGIEYEKINGLEKALEESKNDK